MTWFKFLTLFHIVFCFTLLAALALLSTISGVLFPLSVTLITVGAVVATYVVLALATLIRRK